MNRLPRWCSAMTWLLVFTLLFGTRAILAEEARLKVPSGHGSPWEDLFDAIIFNGKIFYFDKRYNEDVMRAIDEERKRLKPGEEHTYRALVRSVGNDEWVKFVSLARTDQNNLFAQDTYFYGPPIGVSKERRAWLMPLVPVSRQEFDKAFAAAKDPKPRLKYEDYVMAVQAGNLLAGFKTTVDLAQAEQGRVQFPANVWIDLLDHKAYAAAPDARVILVAKEGNPSYSVYNVQSKTVEQAPKGEAMKKAGNALYLLASHRGAEYVVVYRGLSDVEVKAGDNVKVGDVVGALKTDSQPGSSIELWRVFGPDQYFIRAAGKPDGPYPVWGR